jgi:plasmid maintenance system antidote protein VapI
MNSLTQPGYQPERLIDAVREKLALPSDGALCRAIDITRSQISKIRNKRIEISAGMWIVLSELTGMTIGALRELAGLPNRMYIGA